MMNRFRASLFLTEIIIVIFFFSLSAAVCLRIFAKAHTLSHSTEETSDAVLWAQNAGELFYEYGEDFSEKTKGLFESVPEGYEIRLDLSKDEAFLYLDYSYISSSDERCVYSLSFKQHIKEVSE